MSNFIVLDVFDLHGLYNDIWDTHAYYAKSLKPSFLSSTKMQHTSYVMFMHILWVAKLLVK